MLSRNALLVLVACANLAVGLAIAAQRGCFTASRPKSVRIVDLETFAKLGQLDSQAFVAEYRDQWVLIGGKVISTSWIPYDFSERWYVQIASSVDQPPPYITLEFEVGQADKVRKLRNGDSIVVIGHVGSVYIIDRCGLMS